MNTTDIKEDFYKAEVTFSNTYGTDNRNVAVAIFQGLKLIALAIIYHANNR